MKIATKYGWLEPLNTTQAEALFELAHSGRHYLHKWLPSLSSIHSVHDTIAFIEQVQTTGPQFVVRLEDGTLCGCVGFYLMDDVVKSATVGYWLGVDFMGQGIMIDALRAACRYAFLEAGFATLNVRCLAFNEVARRLPKRLGFKLMDIEPEAQWLSDELVDHAIYKLTREEYLLQMTPTPKVHNR